MKCPRCDGCGFVASRHGHNPVPCPLCLGLREIATETAQEAQPRVGGTTPTTAAEMAPEGAAQRGRKDKAR